MGVPADLTGFSDGEFEHEILTLRAGRWAVEALAVSEEEATETAKRLVTVSGVDSVQVVSVRRNRLGVVSRTEMLTLTAPPRSDVPTVRPAGQARVCATPEDLVGLEGRLILGRVLRAYFERHRLTAVEQLHGWRAIRRLRDGGSLLVGAVHQVARAQAGRDGSSRIREAELHRMLEGIEQRARDFMAVRRPPRLDPADPEIAARRLRAEFGDEEAMFWGARSTVANWVSDMTSVDAKAMAAANLLASGAGPFEEATGALLADAISDPGVLREALGRHWNLGSCLCTLAGFLSGRREPPTPLLALTGRLITEGKAREARLALIERLVAEIARDHPLDKHDTGREETRLHELVEYMITADGQLIGGGAAEAVLAKRMVRARITRLRGMGLHAAADQVPRNYTPDVEGLVKRTRARVCQPPA